MGKCKELGATPDAKAFARSGALLPKKFYDELFPLAIYVQREFSSRADARVSPHLGNANFDATITDPTASGTERKLFVEITFSKDGYDGSLRMEYLSKHGHANLTGPVSVVGRRGNANRRIEIEPEAANHSVLLEQQLSLLRARIEAKASKSYGQNYILLVAVDDYFPLRQEDDEKHIDGFLRDLIPSLDLDFGRIVVIGVAGKIFLSYPAGTKT